MARGMRVYENQSAREQEWIRLQNRSTFFWGSTWFDLCLFWAAGQRLPQTR